tara:strand:- start:319 stop:762 length:444 start_codon:yes stop_codon:yes gene_type:complete
MKKNKRLRLENIYVGDSEVEGRGVFAGEDICAGTLIEEAHYIIMENPNWEKCDKELIKYVFALPELQEGWKDFCDEHGGVTIAQATRPLNVLGFGMIYNHSKNNSVVYKIEAKRGILTYRTTKDVEEGEELTIDYGEEYWSNREDEK